MYLDTSVFIDTFYRPDKMKCPSTYLENDSDMCFAMSIKVLDRLWLQFVANVCYHLRLTIFKVYFAFQFM